MNAIVSRAGAPSKYVPSAIAAVAGTSATTPGDDMALDLNTSVVRVAAVAPPPSSGTVPQYALSFPGWTDPAWEDHPEYTEGVIPDEPYFDPLDRPFSVGVWVRVDAALTHPPQSSDQTPNIVQKGRQDQGNGQQWKVSLDSSLHPMCTFRGAPNSTTTTVPGPGGGTILTEARAVSSVMQLTPGQPYRIVCRVASGRAQLTLLTLTDTGAVHQVGTVFGAAGPATYYVAPDDIVSVGKKPREETTGNTYVGVVDDLQITRD